MASDETKTEYSDTIISPAEEFADRDEPFGLFEEWFADAQAHEPNDPNAMAIASVDADGLPNVRMVLLKGLDEVGFGSGRGFVFYTNLESAKGCELRESGKAALLFHWKSLRRQVRIRGLVSQVSDDEADAYFSSRARGSRIGAWASKQSRPLEGRFALEKAVAGYAAKFHIGAIPRPDYWSGFRVCPVEMEFWHDRPFRLHERLVFRRASPEDGWQRDRLFP